MRDTSLKPLTLAIVAMMAICSAILVIPNVSDEADATLISQEILDTDGASEWFIENGYGSGPAYGRGAITTVTMDHIFSNQLVGYAVTDVTDSLSEIGFTATLREYTEVDGVTIYEVYISGQYTENSTQYTIVTSRSTSNGGVGCIIALYFEPVITYVSSITISQYSGSTTVGSTLTLRATTSPTDADDRTVTWSITSGSSRASIQSTTDTSTGGRVTLSLTSAGSVTVRATANDGGGTYATYTFTITNPSYDFTLQFNANGGTGAPSSQSYTSSSSTYTTTIPATTPTRSGYNFLGWSTSSTATVATYDPGDQITLSSGTTTLYAVWSAEDVVITSTQGDAVLTVGQTFSYVVSTNLSGCTITVSGADWLSVSGSTVSGMPTVADTYTVTVTASLDGHTSSTQTFTITVYSAMGFTSTPEFAGIYAYAE